MAANMLDELLSLPMGREIHLLDGAPGRRRKITMVIIESEIKYGDE